MELVYDNGYIMGCGLCVEGIAKGRYRRDALECASAWRRLTTRAQTLEYSISKKIMKKRPLQFLKTTYLIANRAEIATKTSHHIYF